VHCERNMVYEAGIVVSNIDCSNKHVFEGIRCGELKMTMDP
jgi:hypothetical protein